MGDWQGARLRPSFQKHVGIQWKLAIGASLLAILITYLTSGFLLFTAYESLREGLRSKVAAVAASTAANIDPALLEAARVSGGAGSPAYRELQRYLQAGLSASPDIRSIHAMIPTTSPLIWQHVVEVTSDQRPEVRIGEPYDITAHPGLRGALVVATADAQIRLGDNGKWLAGYAPIRDSAGRTVGIVDVEMSADAVVASESRLRDTLAITLAGATVLAALLATLLARHFTVPLRLLVKCMERVGQGDLRAFVPLRRTDELGEVATRFNHMVARLRSGNDALVRLANTDSLTSLPNYRRGQELLIAETERAASEAYTLAVMMLDVDNFKLFNDSYGHARADQVLTSVAQAITSSIRTTDMVARYGGDEFLLVLPTANAADAEGIARRILHAVGNLTFRDEKGRQIPITCSLGLAVYPEDGRDARDLLHLADSAMYEVKRSGGRGYQMANRRSDALLAGQSGEFGVLEGLVGAVDAKDHYTRAHSETVTRIALAIATHLDLPEDLRQRMRVAGLLHDVGKIGIPNKILRKPAALDEAEYAVMQRHSLLGALIIQEVSHLADIVSAVRHLHERFDGQGYPDGLEGEEIPLLSRVLAVADAYAAMTADRPYRKALKHNEAIGELRKLAGRQFDPAIVSAFASLAGGSDILAIIGDVVAA